MPAESLTSLWFQILVVLASGANHGYGIIKELEARLGEFQTATGPVYLALRRMTEEGLIAEARAEPGGDQRRRRYRITPAGRSAVRSEAARFARLLGLDPLSIDLPG